jgi:hypothetical protein
MLHAVQYASQKLPIQNSHCLSILRHVQDTQTQPSKLTHNYQVRACYMYSPPLESLEVAKCERIIIWKK